MSLEIVFLYLLAAAQAMTMPEFIPTCKRSDPNLNECARKMGQISITGIIKGDRKYQLPNMTPLKIPKIDIHAGNNLRILLENNEVRGLDKTIVTGTDIQFDKRHMIFKVFIPRANIRGRYKMDGRILILPIKGQGPANITFLNAHYNYSMNYNLIQKNGEDYMNITDHSIVFNTTRAYYEFHNLFSGNAVGQQMYSFLNDNWESVTKDMGATVGETISSIITSLAKSIFEKVPFNQVFTP